MLNNTGGYGFLGVVTELHFPDKDHAKNLFIVEHHAFRVFIR